MKRLMAATAFTLIAATCPIYAQSAVELTLEQYIAMGNASAPNSITYSSKDSGADYVEYRDLKIVPPDGSASIEFPTLRAAAANGMTTLTFPATVKVSFTAPGDTGPSSFTLASENLVVTTNIVVPDPSTLTTFHVELAAGSIKLSDLVSGNPALKELAFDMMSPALSFDLDMATMKTKGGLTVASYNVAFVGEDTGMATTMKTKGETIDIAFDMDVPAGEEDMPAYLKGEKNMLVTFALGPNEGASSITSPELSYALEGKADGSSGSFSMVDGNLLLNSQGTGATYMVSSDTIGLAPTELIFKDMVVNYALPFGSTDAMAPANIAIKLGELTIGEGLWAMFDPAQTLPRDPLTIDVNLNGNVQFDPNFVEMMETMPQAAMKFENVDFTSFLIAAAGAKFSATGNLTFDPNLPVPAPSGILTVAIDGVTGLAEKLVGLGMIPPEQVEMLAPLLGVYAVPVGEDSYTSDIEFKGMEPPTINGQMMPM